MRDAFRSFATARNLGHTHMRPEQAYELAAFNRQSSGVAQEELPDFARSQILDLLNTAVDRDAMEIHDHDAMTWAEMNERFDPSIFQALSVEMADVMPEGPRAAGAESPALPTTGSDLAPVDEAEAGPYAPQFVETPEGWA